MKKILVSTILIVFTTITAYGSTITYDNISSFSDLTVSKYNNNLNKLYTKVNTDITGENVASGTLTHDNMAANSRLSNYQTENLGDYVYTGLTLPSTGSATDATISAGTAYINGLRIVKSAETKNFSNTTTWVYIDQNGTYNYIEQVAQPTTPVNSIILGNVVAAGGTISSADESYRQTVPPNLRLYQNYRYGLVLSYDTAAQFKVNPGEIDLGSAAGAGLRRNTSPVPVTWSDLDVGVEQQSMYYFVYAYPSTTNATNAAFAISINSTDSAKSYDRLIGWFWNDESGNISQDSISCWKGDGSGVPNVARTQQSNTITTVSTSPVDLIGLRFYSSGYRPVRIRYTSGVSNNNALTAVYGSLSIDGTAFRSTYSGSRAGQSVGEPTGQLTGEWVGVLGAGPHHINARWQVEGGTGNSYSRSLVAEEL